jgi:hypothetical protein
MISGGRFTISGGRFSTSGGLFSISGGPISISGGRFSISRSSYLDLPDIELQPPILKNQGLRKYILTYTQIHCTHTRIHTHRLHTRKHLYIPSYLEAVAVVPRDLVEGERRRAAVLRDVPSRERAHLLELVDGVRRADGVAQLDVSVDVAVQHLHAVRAHRLHVPRRELPRQLQELLRQLHLHACTRERRID